MITIVIPTNNRPCIADAVRSILSSSTTVAFEIIVIGRDDGHFIPVHSSLRFIETEPGLKPGALRNRGVKAASGEKILFTDDDCIVRQHWIENADRCITARSPVVGGAIDIPTASTWDMGDNLAIFHPFHPSASPHIVTTYIGTNNLGVMREVFEAIGGFREDIFPDEDWDFLNRLRAAGHIIRFDPTFVVLHNSGRDTRQKVVDHARGYARGYISMLKRGAETGSTFRMDKLLAKSSAAAVLWSWLKASLQTAKLYLGNPGFLKYLRGAYAVWLFYYVRRVEIITLSRGGISPHP